MTKIILRIDVALTVIMRVNSFMLFSLFFVSSVVAGQESQTSSPAKDSTIKISATDLPFNLEGPPIPVSPEVITRDAQGRATMRAVRLTSPLRIDGVLDEDVYQEVKSVSDFYQMEPLKGAPASDKTEVWLLFDDDQVYFVARCWEEDPTRIMASDMRRDGPHIIQGDYVGFILDTFYDRRNGVIINISAVGGRRDGLVTDETQFNVDWNGVFDSAIGRFEGGWTVEVAVPFKTLRYSPGREQLWGFNVHRGQRWKNERTYLMPMPGLVSPGALMQVSMAATVVGIEAPLAAKNIEIKPYVISSAGVPQPGVSTDLNADVGVDVKYGVSQNLTADFTYNTDFAQVEADEQQVNLTRFSLFFPEKREFFLENAGLFAFGGSGTGPYGGAGDTPILFYSRRVGLSSGQAVPINVGGRLNGRVGSFSVGAMNIQTSSEPVSGAPATNFSVLRFKRDILRRSSIGAIFAGRSVSLSGIGTNQTYGVDGAFAFFTNLAINTYWAQTRTNGSVDANSYRVQFDYDADRYGAKFEHLVVGDNFNPEVGFLRRDNMRRSFAQLRFSPRTKNHSTVRQLSWVGSVDYKETTEGHLETRNQHGEFSIEFHNSDLLSIRYDNSYEFIPVPFRIASDVTIPVRGYHFNNARISYGFGRQRMLSGTVASEYGTFYDGSKATLSISRSLVALTSQLSIIPTVSVNRVVLPAGAFTSHLVATRLTYTMTPMMFASTLVQYNSSVGNVSTNVRFRWEYHPGSELFVVYNEQHYTHNHEFPGFQNRAVIVKLNRLFRF